MADVIVEREQDARPDMYPSEEHGYPAMEVEHVEDNPALTDEEPSEPQIRAEDRTAHEEEYEEQYEEQHQEEEEPAQPLDDSPGVRQDQYEEHTVEPVEHPQEHYEQQPADSIDDDAIHVAPEAPEAQYEEQREDPYEEDQYDDEAVQPFEQLRPRRARRAIYDEDTNSQSPQPMLPTISPSMVRSRSGRVCLRPVCSATQPSGVQWGCSPDGRWTLCLNCYGLYSALLLPLFERPDGSLSILNTPGSYPMRITDFAYPRGRSRRDLSKPLVTPITDSPEDQALLSNQYATRVRQSRKRKRVERDPVTPPRAPLQPARISRSIPGNYSLAAPMGYMLDEEQRRVAPSMSVGLKEGEGVYIRAEWNNDTRRFQIPDEVTLEQFKREVRAVFGFKKGFLFCVTYQDEEDNFVRVASDETLTRVFNLVDPDSMAPIRVRLVA